MSPQLGAWHTEPVNAKDLWIRPRHAAAALLRAAGPRPKLSRWAWVADVVLAAVLAIGIVVADLDRDVEVDVYAPPGQELVLPEEQLPQERPLPPGFRMPDEPVPPPGYEWRLREPPGDPLSAVQPWELALGVLVALPLAVRRRYPLAAFGAVSLVTLWFHVGSVSEDAAAIAFAACLIAAYSAAMYSPYRRAAVVSVALAAVVFATAQDGVVPQVSSGWLPLLILLPLGLAANTLHTWQQRIRRLQAEQEQAARRAAEQERARIARELHDVVTHNVSVMTIQAGAARKVLDASPDQAREAMQAVEASGRAALAELRQAMGLLTMAAQGDGHDGRDPAVAVELAPQPGLDRLEPLAGRIRDAGVPVDLTVSGTPGPLPAGVDLAAYRVVQEALTNAVKHAAGAHVRVAVEHAPDAIRVEVTDTGGHPSAAAAAGNGRGLIGLRERLAVYGGTLEAGRRPRGGYRVRAEIPVREGAVPMQETQRAAPPRGRGSGTASAPPQAASAGPQSAQSAPRRESAETAPASAPTSPAKGAK
ncbi:sensor histidine kinase [Streptomyces boninensis]|uniref:sensor histidine kinase n=1 Tax=Streptomyces boninensis TaxID=2039455 RepID=UPI003B20CC72